MRRTKGDEPLGDFPWTVSSVGIRLVPAGFRKYFLFVAMPAESPRNTWDPASVVVIMGGATLVTTAEGCWA
jgi:hypothetical protein